MMRYFFKTYCGYKSRFAASMWIDLDEEYILHQLSNEEISSIVKLTDKESFLAKVQGGMRNDDVRSLVKEKLPENPKKNVKEVVNDSFLYEVQKGDSFWKIAQKHGVSIEAIKKQNDMSSDLLRPGQSILIPKK